MTEDRMPTEWQAPPPPEKIVPLDPPQMSELSTLGGIFFEPGKTFEDLKRKPRFIIALIIMIVLGVSFAFAFKYKVGDEAFKSFALEQINKSPQADNMTPDQKNNAVNINMTVVSAIRYALPVIILIFTALGGLIYWLAAKAFGGNGNFLHGVSVWVYSSFPPTIVSTVANFIILAFKSVDDIDIATSQRGLVQANPGILLDGKAMPVITTIVSVFDLFIIWGWVLASIGLQKTNKISAGSAWAITIILAFISIAFRVVGAYFSGNPS